MIDIEETTETTQSTVTSYTESSPFTAFGSGFGSEFDPDAETDAPDAENGKFLNFFLIGNDAFCAWRGVDSQ